jgi:hypothetical protein
MTVYSRRRSGSSISFILTAFGGRRDSGGWDCEGRSFCDTKLSVELCNIIKSFESSLLRSEKGLNSDDEVITLSAVRALTASEVEFPLGNLFRAVSLC